MTWWTNLILILLVLVLNIQGESQYLLPGFPSSLLTPWHRITPTQINCRFSGHDASTYSTNYYDVELFSVDKVKSEEKVYLCSAWELVTSCYEHWYFTSEVIHIKRPATLSVSECKGVIAQGLLRFTDLPTDPYPDPNCYWLRTVDTIKRVIHVQEIELNFDFYTNSLVDNRLLTGFCSQEVCKGTSENFLIIRKPDYKEHCDHWVKKKVKISEHMIQFEDSKEDYFVSSQCDLKFCGKVGKRIGHGLFISVPDGSANWALARTSTCPTGSVNVSSSPMTVLKLNFDIEKIAYDAYQECMLARDIIISTGRVTPHLLAQIAPLKSGYVTGEIYRYVNGSLEVSTGQYRTISLYPDNSDRGCLKGDTETRCFDFKGWVFNGTEPPQVPYLLRTRGAMLINGITLLEGGTFVYPSNWKWINTVSQETTRLEPGIIKPLTPDHPVLSQKAYPTQRRVQSFKSFNISALFDGKWYHKFVWSLIFILCSLLSTFLIYFLFKNVCRQKYFRNNDQELPHVISLRQRRTTSGPPRF
ncbi:TPA_asm: G protein [Sphaeridiorhabdovirus 2]|nr:TPA_asm: G protein [Sphaeridiorhabdovirus 2]